MGPMRVFAETPRLYLREFTADDADLLFELDSDPAVMHFITGGVLTSRQAIETGVLPTLLDYHRRSPGFGFWAVVERASDEFIGWIHFRPRPDDPPGHIELGYRLRQRSWGQGYAAEASQAVIERGFGDFGVERVVAETMVVNTASRRVMEKCGLRQIRVFHADWPYPIPGDEHGDVEYALTREEWAAAGSGRPDS